MGLVRLNTPAFLINQVLSKGMLLRILSYENVEDHPVVNKHVLYLKKSGSSIDSLDSSPKNKISEERTMNARESRQKSPSFQCYSVGVSPVNILSKRRNLDSSSNQQAGGGQFSMFMNGKT